MSTVELRVELPSYSHSFLIQVPLSYTILDVKEEITRSCPGAPRADGQRIIWRGRVLGNEEMVQNVWKSSEDSRVIHLAVNPSAWTTDPPPIPGSDASSPPLPSSAAPPPPPPPVPVRSYYAPVITNPNHPMTWVISVHQNAILALTSGVVARMETVAGRSLAVYVLERNGYAWPSVLDEPYPGADTEGNMLASLPEGVRYVPVPMDGQMVLHLQNPGATPNIFQAHALKVLTHTFPLFTLPVYTTGTTTTTSNILNHPTAVPREVNQLLQQLGLPPLRVAGVAPERRMNIVMRDIPIRALFAPLMMLAFRTMLLVYFVSPTRKPFFGLLIAAWIIYEAWGPLRAALNGAAEREAAQAGPLPAQRGQQAGAVPAGDGAGQNGIPAQAGAPAPGPVAHAPGQPAAARHVAHAGAFLDSLANINIPTEAQALAASERTPPAPGPKLMHKITTFIALLLFTLHPAIWDRRRVVLRQREGRLRTEAHAREREPEAPTPDATAEGDVDGNAQRSERERVAAVRADLIAAHARRPRWVQDYVERARSGEWVDD